MAAQAMSGSVRSQACSTEVGESPLVLEKWGRFSVVMTEAATRFSLLSSLMALAYDDHKLIKRLPDATKSQAQCHHPAVRRQIPNQFGFWLLCQRCGLKMVWVPKMVGTALQIPMGAEVRERVRQQIIRHRLKPYHMGEDARWARPQRQKAQGRVTSQQQPAPTTTQPPWPWSASPPPVPPLVYNLDDARRAGQAAHQASIEGTRGAVEYL